MNEEILRELESKNSYEELQIFDYKTTRKISLNFDTDIGWVLFPGLVLKRGPIGIPVIINNEKDYHEIFGDPRDKTWHLFPFKKNERKLSYHPEIVEGFFQEAERFSKCIIIRNKGDGNSKKAEKTFYTLNSNKLTPVLQLVAANEGRWGGASQKKIESYVLRIENNLSSISLGTDEEIETDQYEGGELFFVNQQGEFSKGFRIVEHSKTTDGVFNVVLNEEINLNDEFFRKIYSLYNTSQKNFVSSINANVSLNSLTLELVRDSRIFYKSWVRIPGRVSSSENNSLILEGKDCFFSFFLEKGKRIKIKNLSNEVREVIGNNTLILKEEIIPRVEEEFLFFLPETEIFIEADSWGKFAPAFNREEKIKEIIGEKIILNNKEIRIKDVKVFSGEKIYIRIILEKELKQTILQDTLLLRNSFLEVNTGTGNIEEGKEYIVNRKIIRVQKKEGNQIRFIGNYRTLFQNQPVFKPLLKAIIRLKKKEGLAVEICPTRDGKYFSLNLYFNKKLVLDYPKLCLDKESHLFIEKVINQDKRNLIQVESKLAVKKWIEAKVLNDKEKNSNIICSVFGRIVTKNTSLKKIFIEEYPIKDEIFLEKEVKIFYKENQLFQELKGLNYQSSKKIKIDNIQGNIIITSEIFDLNSFIKINFSDGTSGIFFVRQKVSNGYRIEPSINTGLVFEEAFLLASFVVDSYNDFLSLRTGQEIFISFPEFLEGGYDGTFNKSEEFLLNLFTVEENKLKKFLSGKNLGCVRISTPFFHSYKVIEAVSRFAKQNFYEYRVEVPPEVNSISSLEDWIYTLKENDFLSITYPSYGYVRNSKGETIFCSLVGDILGLETREFSLSGSYYAKTSGIEFFLKRVEEMDVICSIEEEHKLNELNVQYLIQRKNKIRHWGNKGLAQEAILTVLPIRRTYCHYVRKFLEEETIKRFLFSPLTEESIKGLYLWFKSFFEREVEKKNIADFGEILFFIFSDEENNRNFQDLYSLIQDNRQKNMVVVKKENNSIMLFIFYTPSQVLNNITIILNPEQYI